MGNTRATELDESWAKGHARLAEVYVAKDQLELAVKAYEKAISVGSKKDKKTYTTLHDKVKAKWLDPNRTGLTQTIPLEAVKDGLYGRIKEALPDPKQFNPWNPCPLGWMSAADKVAMAYLHSIPALTQI
jgi:hypothetical protein